MNNAAQHYWKTFWQDKGQDAPKNVTAWAFGSAPDELAQLVVDGWKTATCSGHLFYELENEPLPAVDDYSIVLNSEEEPVAIIRAASVEIMPMNEVPESFAIAEGEGDRTYEYWYRVHEEFFTEELQSIGREFTPEMLLVCERFELVDVKKQDVFSK